MTYNCCDNLILPLQGMSMESVQRKSIHLQPNLLCESVGCFLYESSFILVKWLFDKKSNDTCN